jgi:hypothetical protein
MSRRVAAFCLAGAALSVLVGSVPIGGSDASAAEVQHQVARLLHEREQAVDISDADAWLATVEEPATPAQRAEFEALERLDLEAWSERLITLEPGPRGSWRAHVQVRYRLPGDPTPAVVDAVLDVTSRLLVAGSAAAAVPPWEIADVQAHAGRHSLVLGADAGEPLRTYADELDRASTSVSAVLGGPPPRLVLVIPADWDQAGRMVPARLNSGLAAVTSQLGPPGTNDGPARILAPAGVLARLDPATRTAVFGHEAFHVATRASGSVPRWLAEGLADYAGYRGTGIALERAVPGLIRHARVHGVPTALPTDAAFDDPRDAAWAYEGSHLAVMLLVAEHGVADVVTLYQEVASRGAVAIDEAVREILGTDLASITASWRAEVSSLAVR